MRGAVRERRYSRAAGTLAASSLLAALGAVPAASIAAPAPAARPAATSPSGPVAFADAATAARRRATAAPGTSAQRRAREDLVRRLGPQTLVDVDAATGTVRSLQRLDGALTDPAAGDRVDVARRYLAAEREALGLTQADVDALVLQDARTVGAGGITLVRFRQVVAGIPAFSGGLRVALDRGGRVLSVTGAPLSGLSLSTTTPALDAVAAARAGLGRTTGVRTAGSGARRVTTLTDGTRAELTVFTGSGTPQLAWHVTGPDADGALVDAVVDAASGVVLLRQSLTKGASGPLYPNYPGAESDPDAAKAAANAPISVDFVDAGWLPSGATTLDGRRVHAYSDVDDDDDAESAEEVAPTSPEEWSWPLTPFAAPATTPKACGSATSAADTTATCTWDPSTLGSWRTNRAQTTVQSFYLANTYADHLAAAPIDFDDFTGTQALRLETDDGATTGTSQNAPNTAHVNNANMTTPPAGQAPRMQMYLHRYRTTVPLAYRNVNGGDSAAIVWHELTHGLSNRLVTYDDGTGALSSAQGAALGEAWSDWYALDELSRRGLETDSPEVSGDVVFGGYVEADPGALRTEGLDCAPDQAAPRCPGGASSGPGGYTYGDFGKVLSTGPEVHADGEIWAQTLWDLRRALITRAGSLEAGSRLAEQLITDGMRLTPPEPTFLDARNAILAAATAQSSALRDVVWSVMAPRGLGFFAGAVDGTDTAPSQDFSLPPAPGAPSGTLTGTVSDTDTGLGIGGVKVTFGGLSGNGPADGRDLATTTAADGTYRLSAPAGTYGTLTFGGLPGVTQAVRHAVTLTAGGTTTADQALQRNWAASANGATIASSDESAAGFGCGSVRLLDGSSATGWSAFNPDSTSAGNPHAGTPTATVTLPRAVTLSAVAIDPAPVCGDPATAALKEWRIQAAGPDGVFVTVAQGTAAPADAGHLTTVPATAAGPVTQVRLLMLSAQGAASDFFDAAALEAYGAPPNQLPSGRLVATPAAVVPGQAVRLDASSFTDPDSRITGYDWDFDANGTVDRTTAEPTTQTSYTTAGTRTARVSVRDFRGGAGAAGAVVTVVGPPPPPPTTTGSTTTTVPTTTAIDPTRPPVESPRLLSVVGSKKGKATVQVSCPAACTLAATGTLPAATAKRIGRRSRTAAQLKRALKAGASKATVSLSGAVVGSAKRRSVRKLKVTFTVSVTTGTGATARLTRTLTLAL